MSRLIDADVAEKILREYADDVGCNRGEYELANGILKAVCRLDDIPTVEAKPVVHGKWKLAKDVSPLLDTLKCSNCGTSYRFMFMNFCPNCGARMDMRGEKHD